MINSKTLAFIVFVFVGFLQLNSQSKYTSNESINSLLAKKRKYNSKNGSGYRIQLYNGAEKRARNIRYNFNIKFPGERTELTYEAPDWKVKVGRYYTKLEADRALNKIKEKFSGAIVIPY